MKAAEKMGKACFERSLSVSMWFELRIWEITVPPASPCFGKHASERLRAFCSVARTTTVAMGPGCKVILLIIQRVGGGKLKAPDHVVY